jgi:hypothetical protein
MDDALLYAKIEQLDTEMAETPLILRPLDIYHALIGKEERDEESLAYLRKITAWFIQRYRPLVAAPIARSAQATTSCYSGMTLASRATNAPTRPVIRRR